MYRALVSGCHKQDRDKHEHRSRHRTFRSLACEVKAFPETFGVTLGVAAALIWGSYLAMARAGISSGLAAPDIAFIRYSVAGVVMLPWLLAHHPASLAGVGWRRGVVLALLAGPLFVLIGAGGFRFAPLAHGAVIQPAALTCGAMIAAAIVFREQLTLARMVGLATILVGLIVIAGPGLFQGTAMTPIGDAMFATAGLMWAGFTVLSKRWSISPMASTAAVSVVSVLAYAPVYLALIGTNRLMAMPFHVLGPQIIVQGVLSGVAAVLAFSAQSKCSAQAGRRYSLRSYRPPRSCWVCLLTERSRLFCKAQVSSS